MRTSRADGPDGQNQVALHCDLSLSWRRHLASGTVTAASPVQVRPLKKCNYLSRRRVPPTRVARATAPGGAVATDIALGAAESRRSRSARRAGKLGRPSRSIAAGIGHLYRYPCMPDDGAPRAARLKPSSLCSIGYGAPDTQLLQIDREHGASDRRRAMFELPFDPSQQYGDEPQSA